MRGWVAIVGVAVAAATVTPAAEGAPGWSTPETVSGRDAGEAPVLAPSPRGGATVAWREQRTGRWLSRRIDARGAWSGGRRLLLPAAQPAPDGARPYREIMSVVEDRSGALVTVWYRLDGPLRISLFARRTSARGRHGAVRLLGRASVMGRPDEVPSDAPEIGVAVDRLGNATVAWASVRGELDGAAKGIVIAEATLHVRRLRSDGTLAPPVELPAGDAWRHLPRVAVTTSGKAAIAWLGFTPGSGGGARAATLNRDGALTGVYDVSGSEDGYRSGLAVAADAADGFVFTWVGDAAGAAPPPVFGAPPEAVVLRRLAADGRLSPVQELSSAGRYTSPIVAADRAGNATVVWRQWLSGGQDQAQRSVVQARRASAGGSLGALWNLSRSPSWVADREGFPAAPQLYLDGAGHATAAWTDTFLVDGLRRPMALARRIPAGEDPGPLHTLATGESDVGLHDLQLGAGSRSDTIALWQRDQGVYPWEVRHSSIEVSRWAPRCPRAKPRRGSSRAAPRYVGCRRNARQ